MVMTISKNCNKNGLKRKLTALWPWNCGNDLCRVMIMTMTMMILLMMTLMLMIEKPEGLGVE